MSDDAFYTVTEGWLASGQPLSEAQRRAVDQASPCTRPNCW